jgi:YbbR domain-containing protein
MSERQAKVPRRLQQVLASVRRFFDTGNLLRFLFSMVLAFSLWAWVTYQNDPETTRMLGGLPVTIENLDTRFEVPEDPPTVDVTVQGPQSVVSPLERDSVVATVDMSEVESEGEHELEVSVNVPSDVRVRDVVPEAVTVEVEAMTSQGESLRVGDAGSSPESEHAFIYAK